MLIALLLGWLPLGAYVAINILYFGSMLPQSAVAKDLVRHPRSEFFFPEGMAIFHSNYFRALSAIWLAAAGTWVFQAAQLRSISLSDIFIALWPLVFLALALHSSPWPLWSWYAYPFVISAGLLFRDFSSGKSIALVCRASFALCAILSLSFALKFAIDTWRGSVNGITRESLLVQDFYHRHPGQYAMGDRAGMVGYLLPHGVLQLEGLVGGRAVIRAISSQENIMTFLRQREIDYYIGTNLKIEPSGCYYAEEPRQAGPEAPHMAATICQAPVATYTVAHGTGFGFAARGFENVYVFKVS